ncbi:MAG: RNA-binding protein [Elusimicrobia bacterium]|nr:RNA-binding protein [Elusimicrobiota bacterium]
MGKKLFVGGLPYEMNDAQLKELFGACGAVVSAKVIIDRALNKSKGFGFVEMTTDEQAAAALLKFNNFTLGTRRIMVNEARPMEPRPAGGFPPRPSGGGGAPRPAGGFGERNPNFGADSKAFSDRKNRYDNKKKPRGEGFDKKGGKGGKKGKGHDDDNDGW